LELAYAKSCGFAHLKCGSDAFVLADGERGKLFLFGQMNGKELVRQSFHEELAGEVLSDAIGLGATFHRSGDDYFCTIGAMRCEGTSFIEAALRALVAYRTEVEGFAGLLSER
jgi:hypothetical protein